jgi:hypothetical protein
MGSGGKENKGSGTQNKGERGEKKKENKKEKLVSESYTNGPVWRVGRLSQVNSGSHNRRPRS